MQTRMTRTMATRPILLTVLFALSGCFSLSRGAPPQQYYVLGGSRQSDGARPAVAPVGDSVVIGLRPPLLAEYLATPFIVVRTGPNRVDFSEFDRWGEDLARAIHLSVASHMEAGAPGRRVEIAPWPSQMQPEYLIELQVLHFEGVVPATPGASVGEAHVQVTWEILRRQGEVVLLRGVTEVRESGWVVGDFDELVSLLDTGLGTLAEELTVGLESVLPPRD
jgi:uncharacterized lipoprotein YmbA